MYPEGEHPFYIIALALDLISWGPFRKKNYAGVKTLEGLHSMLGVKSNPANREINTSEHWRLEELFITM